MEAPGAVTQSLFSKPSPFLIDSFWEKLERTKVVPTEPTPIEY